MSHIHGALTKVGYIQFIIYFTSSRDYQLNISVDLEISLRQRLLSFSIVDVDYCYGIQYLAAIEVRIHIY